MSASHSRRKAPPATHGRHTEDAARAKGRRASEMARNNQHSAFQGRAVATWAGRLPTARPESKTGYKLLCAVAQPGPGDGSAKAGASWMTITTPDGEGVEQVFQVCLELHQRELARHVPRDAARGGCSRQADARCRQAEAPPSRCGVAMFCHVVKAVIEERWGLFIASYLSLAGERWPAGISSSGSRPECGFDAKLPSPGLGGDLDTLCVRTWPIFPPTDEAGVPWVRPILTDPDSFRCRSGEL
ncbi:hypothetical protein C2857_007461 [Epichloe festucae Fl1]|uniref:Uncharacterized protein n=1 Tax=Epichloe festucae (strain Fl1) TaxID=877507 RepID=A0A7S9KR53_EPIFF|nr:hypothetical protein C2857_007461 [Epichloe festucae Fl1]